MSGCYGGLQALIKDQINRNILYIHCYAHTLNLVLADSAAIAVDVVTLFGNLETLYVLFSRSHKVHNVLESIQLSHGLPIRSLKRLNTVRWNAREMCLWTLLDRYESILEALDIVHTDTSFDTKHRSEAAGLLISIQTKQFLATALLFSEIFAITGPLSRYLQSIDNDLSKAMNMIDVSIASLEKMRNGSFDVIKTMDDTFKHIQSIQWHTTRARRPKGVPGTSGSPETPESKWKHETLYVVLDSVLSSMRNRFEKNRSLYEMLSVFSPNCFPRLSEMYNTVYDLTRAVTSFCEKYNLDSKRCAEELFCFARAYSKLHSSEFVCT